MTSLVSSPWSNGRQFTVEAEGVYTERFKLLASDGKSNHEFGYSVAISKDGNTVAVGSTMDDTNGAYAGAVYIFTYDGTYWTQQAKILPSDGVAQQKFGYSIALSGDGNTLVVGAVSITSWSSYVFTRTSSNWSQQAKWNYSDDGSASSFGCSVSISEDGNVALIGASGMSSDKGAAYVFIRTGVTWAQQSELVGSDSDYNDYFGTSVSISGTGDVAVVGSPYNSLSGSVYVFTRSGAVWTQQAKIKANDGASGDKFGISVSISADGTVLLIGTEIPAGGRAKAVYIFTFSGSTWSQSSKISGAYSDRFGSVVAISGDASISMIGCTLDTSTLDWKGSAYAFSRAGSTWTQSSKLIPSDGITYNGFAESLAISSDSRVVVVGARGDDDKGSRSGSAYIFTRTIADTSFENGSNLISPELERIAAGFGYNVAMDDTGLEMLVSHLYSNKSTDESFEVEDRGNVIFYKRGAYGLFEPGLKLKPEIPIDVTLPSGGSLTLSSTGYTKNVTSSGRIWIPELRNTLSMSGKGSSGSSGRTLYSHNVANPAFVNDSDPGISYSYNPFSNPIWGLSLYNGQPLAGQSGNWSTNSYQISITGPGVSSKPVSFTINNRTFQGSPTDAYAYLTATLKNDAGENITVRVQWENQHSDVTYNYGAYNGQNVSASYLGKEYVFPGGTTDAPYPTSTYLTAPGNQPKGLFGFTSAMDRSMTDSVLRAYVTMLNKSDVTASDALPGLVFTYKLPSTSPTTVIQSPDTVDKKTDSFGYALSVSKGSEFLAVSDPEVSISGYANAGRVYIYKRNVDDWVLEKKLDQNTASTLNGKFGSSISLKKDPITGTYILAVKSSNKIELYYRVESGGVGNWVLSQTFTASAGESFGGAIAFSTSCNRLVAASGTKHVYIFDRNGSNVSWSRSSTVLEIKHPNKDTTALSGRNISISENGNVIVIGSYDATTKGQLDVFRFSSGTWVHVKTLTPPGAGFNANGSAYGWSHAMSEDGTALIAGVNDLSMTTPTFVNYVY